MNGKSMKVNESQSVLSPCPCPFCGSRVALGSNPDDRSNAGWRIVHPRNGCYIGECYAPPYMPRDALVEKWNRRAKL